jgi:hypothetical protein
LIWLKDIDLIVRRGDLDWTWLLEAADGEGVTNSLKRTLYLSAKYLDTPVPASIKRWAGNGTGIAHLLWRERDLLNPYLRRQRWRRAVQYVPWDGLRGAIPSLLFMGRRLDKVKSLVCRAWARLRVRPSGR